MTPEEKKLFKKISIYFLFGIFFLIVFFGGFFIVQPGTRAFTVYLGSVNETIYTNGLHFKMPIISKVVKFDIQTQKLESQSTASSKDLQSVSCDAAINFAINPDTVISLYKSIGNLEEIKTRIIMPTIQESVKAITAKYTAEELITKRAIVSTEIMQSLKDKLGSIGVLVSAFNIINFDFSKEFNASIEQKVKAEQDALTQKNKLEQVKYEAQQQIEKAKAEAESIRIQAQAITSQGGDSYVKLQRINKRDGKLPVTTLGDNMQMLMQM